MKLVIVQELRRVGMFRKSLKSVMESLHCMWQQSKFFLSDIDFSLYINFLLDWGLSLIFISCLHLEKKKKQGQSVPGTWGRIKMITEIFKF